MELFPNDAKIISLEDELVYYDNWKNNHNVDGRNHPFRYFFNNFDMLLPTKETNTLRSRFSKYIDMTPEQIEEKCGFRYHDDTSEIRRSITGREFYKILDDLLKQDKVYDFIMQENDRFASVGMRDNIMYSAVGTYFALRKMGFNRYPDLIR